jgi:ABC-type transport system involved in cytochrome c biogenesis permease subunit
VRGLAAVLLSILTIAWATVAWPGLLLVPGLTPYEYTRADFILFLAIFVAAPLVLAAAWSLLLQRRLPTGNQLKKAGVAVAVLALVAALAIAIVIGADWLRDSTAI